MKTLQLIPLDNALHLDQPKEKEPLTLRSPALSFFTDFTQVTPLVIDSDTSAVDTLQTMKKTHVRLKLVINQSDEVVGIVSADDLKERKIIQKMNKGDKRQDVSVKELMIPTEKLKVLSYEEIANCNISAIIDTLKSLGQQHCLVVDKQSNTIRGLFSVSDISRKLYISIDIYDAPSFLKLAVALD
jgi:CBS domain containing-hemolysin-like protein